MQGHLCKTLMLFLAVCPNAMEVRGTPLHLLSLVLETVVPGAQPCGRFAQLRQSQNFASVFKQVWHCKSAISQPRTLGHRAPRVRFRSKLLLEDAIAMLSR
ncbi:hypothetical protein DE146DRAFT_368104 [Phaeosphaeria sp. MPI-PUGE-AT-0046c]|nr:hypothetical protein DE146DRAFT_368104 [Phaeosphaeria sp. MPI-PUGE-AT-0046c]